MTMIVSDAMVPIRRASGTIRQSVGKEVETHVRNLKQLRKDMCRIRRCLLRRTGVGTTTSSALA